MFHVFILLSLLNFYRVVKKVCSSRCHKNKVVPDVFFIIIIIYIYIYGLLVVEKIYPDKRSRDLSTPCKLARSHSCAPRSRTNSAPSKLQQFASEVGERGWWWGTAAEPMNLWAQGSRRLRAAAAPSLKREIATTRRLRSPADALIPAEETSHQRGGEIYGDAVASGEGRVPPPLLQILFPFKSNLTANGIKTNGV